MKLTRKIEFTISLEEDSQKWKFNINADFFNLCTMNEFTLFASTVIDNAITKTIETDSSLDTDDHLQMIQISESLRILKEVSRKNLIEDLELQKSLRQTIKSGDQTK